MKYLTLPRTEMLKTARIPVSTVSDSNAVVRKFAEDFIADFVSARQNGRRKVTFIVPVGPVGQFDLIAEICNAERISLTDLIVINMDEYLLDDGHSFIPETDPLSFRRHMRQHFYDRLDPVLAPSPDQRIFPDPADLGRVARVIESNDGVDVAYCGVGINGHLAFNDPPESDENDSVEAVGGSTTRVVRLTRETRLINSVTAAKGNVDRIPRFASTVGMKEILDAKKVRVYMNRVWQCAISRKILCGPMTGRVPASLLQAHPDASVVLAEYVTELPEPTLA